MSKSLHRRILLTLVLSVVASVGASAQIRLAQSVIGSGATAASNGTIAMAGTIGQTIIGPALGTPYGAALGFWYTLPTAPSTDVRNDDHLTNGAAELRVMPNPASDFTEIHLMHAQSGAVSVKLYDNVGRMKETLMDAEKEAGNITLRLDVKALESGNYTVVFQDGAHRFVSALRVVK